MYDILIIVFGCALSDPALDVPNSVKIYGGTADAKRWQEREGHILGYPQESLPGELHTGLGSLQRIGNCSRR
jgi:hypothetical protein